MIADEKLSAVRQRITALEAAKCLPRDKTPSGRKNIRRLEEAHQKLNKASGTVIKEVLDELECLRGNESALKAILADCPTLHQRKCHNCGNIAWHIDSRIPWSTCTKCGSLLTEKVERLATVPKAIEQLQPVVNLRFYIEMLLTALETRNIAEVKHARDKIARFGIEVSFNDNIPGGSMQYRGKARNNEYNKLSNCLEEIARQHNRLYVDLQDVNEALGHYSAEKVRFDLLKCLAGGCKLNRDRTPMMVRVAVSGLPQLEEEIA